MHFKEAEHIGCALITLSDTRNPADDASGALLEKNLRARGHRVLTYAVLPDEPLALGAFVEALGQREDIDVIITNGGTGLSRRDQTVQALRSRLTKHLPGFGEAFRRLSWQDVGVHAMLSGAFAGVIHEKLLFVLPGSRGAVALACEKLILPAMGHWVHELRK